MSGMLKRFLALVLVVMSLSLSGCVSAVSGLKSYVDSVDGYQFLYPNGWVQTQVGKGLDVVFHDLIETTENLSVVINPISEKKSLADLGTPTDVGYRLGKTVIAPPGSDRQAELVTAESREMGDKTYYLLEYTVKLPTRERHNLASVAISRGKLFTFNASAPEARWPKVKETLQKVVESFSVY